MHTTHDRTTDIDRDGHERAAPAAAAKLRLALRINAGFSLATGVTLLVAAGPIGSLLDVEQTWLLRLLGVGLLVFAADVWHTAAQPVEPLLRWSAVVTAADFGWVVATVVVIALGLLSVSGAVVCIAVAVVVEALGTAQFLARRRLQHAVGTSHEG